MDYGATGELRYQILRDPDIRVLQNEITREINIGWRCQGGVVFEPRWGFYQAMVR